MPKIYFSLFLFIFSLGFSQSVSLFNPADQVAYPQSQYFCTGEQFNLKVDAVASSTGDYAMTSVSPSDFQLSAGSIPVRFPGASSNIFSEAFPIGFSFSFYGKTYTKVVMGSNGRLVFTNDAELESLQDKMVYKDRTFSGIIGYNTYSTLPSKDYNKVYQNDPSKELNLAQIFFGYTDLVDRSVNSSVTYLYNNVMIGTVKGLLVSFHNQIRTNGTGDISSVGYYSYILLLEDGRVVIYVNGKNEIKYNAILGIQNEDATKFRVPEHSSKPTSDYNNGPWKSEGKAWLFTPNQNLNPKFKWFQNSTLLTETSNTLSNFIPNDNDILKVEVAYEDPVTGTQIGSVVSDQVLFKSISKPIITYNNTAACVTGVTMSTVDDPDLNYQWFRAGSSTVLATGNSFYANGNGSYFVRALRKNTPSCAVDSDPVIVNLNSTIPVFNVNNKPLNFCENTASLTKTINLYDYYAADPTKYTLYFIEGVTQVADPSNFVIQANKTTVVGIFVEDPISGCTLIRNFDIQFNALPLAVTNLSKSFCFGNRSIDVTQYLPEIGGTGFSDFRYEFSTDGITYSNSSSINPQQFQEVWIKILPKTNGGLTCETISTIVFTEESKIIANTPTTQLPAQCANSTQTFDLASLIPEINPDPNVIVTFHTSLENAKDGANPVDYNYRSGLGDTTLYIRVVNRVTSCISTDYPAINLVVYKKPDLLVNSISKANCAGNSVFDITQNPSTLTNASSPVAVTLEYYSANGALLSGGQITNYDANIHGQNPYIKVVYNTTCSDQIAINLTFLPKPVSIASSILICAETSYTLTDFKNKVIANASNYTFLDLSGAPLPATFNLSPLPLSVSFLIKDNATGCISDPQTVSFDRGTNSALLNDEIDYPVCDKDFDGKSVFTLDSKKNSFTSNPAATFEYFKDVNLTQLIGSTYTNEIAFAQTIYVRVTVPNFCPTVAKIHLIVNVPTVSTTLQKKYFICYGDTLVINGGPENASWKWSTGEITQIITVDKPGAYSVELTNQKGCSYIHEFIVSSENQPQIDVINQTNNSIEVIASGGEKPYVYYFNGVSQSSNVLINPSQSSYEIQVKSASGCFGPPKTVYFIKINNTFTPNGDGINEVWKIDNLDQMEQVSILIVDRNGTKVFESKNSTHNEWNGKQNGRDLPTSTYWYVVSWYDAVTQKTEQRQGWILMKNRN